MRRQQRANSRHMLDVGHQKKISGVEPEILEGEYFVMVMVWNKGGEIPGGREELGRLPFLHNLLCIRL